jgi:hypothetical protein
VAIFVDHVICYELTIRPGEYDLRLDDAWRQVLSNRWIIF